MTNRFYRRTPYDIGLYVPPVEVMQQTMALAQQKYNINEQAANAVKDNLIPSLPQDRAKANEIQQQWATQVDSIVAKYNGDYSQAGKELNQLLRNIKKEYGPGGQANAITSNLSIYQDWARRHRERVKSGKVLGEDMNLANNYFLSNYQGIGEIDPVSQSYNQFVAEDLSDYSNPDAIVQDVYKNFKPEKQKIGYTTFKNGLQTYVEQETEGITAQRLAPSFQTALVSDPKLVSYLQQKAKFSGADPSQVANFLTGYSQARANDLSYMNSSNTSKSERDPLMLAREKANMDKQNFEAIMGNR